MKRIWAEVAVKPSSMGFAVTLDGKPLKKPGGEVLILPYKALAEAIAEEWGNTGMDGKNIKPDDLPLTRLATTAQDRVRLARGDIIGQLAAYGLHDLLCYRAKAPATLALLQEEHWQPWLEWAAKNYDVRLKIGTGITPIGQPPDTLEKFSAVLQLYDIYQLASLGVAVPAMGSLILGLALATSSLDADTAFQLATLDEMFQARKWGMDEDAEQSRRVILADIALCLRFIGLCTT